MERFFILFTKRGVVLLALLVVVGPIIALHPDARIAAFLMGLIFAPNGIGKIVVARKDAGGIRWLGFALGVFVLLMGAFLAISAVLMFVVGVPIQVEGI